MKSFVLALFVFGLLWAGGETLVLAAGSSQKIVLKNGKSFVGTIVQMNQNFVELSTAKGVKKIPRSSIASISFVKAPTRSPPPEPQPPEPRPPEPTPPPTPARAYHSPSPHHSPPVRYKYVNTRRGFLVAGLVLLPVGYGLALLSSSIVLATNTYGPSQTAGFLLMIPLAGPFITLGLSADSNSSLRPWIPWWMVLGISQSLGTAFIIVGALGKKKKVPVYARMPFSQTHQKTATILPPVGLKLPSPSSARQ